MRTWQILDVGSIWMKEFASAMAGQAPVVAWSPVMLRLGALQDWERPARSENPPLDLIHYPLQRGYSNKLVNKILPFQDRLLRLLLRHCAEPEQCVLICSTPFYAVVAEKWPGPVVYYATDLTIAYETIDPRRVAELERRMCGVAQSVCPNSSRIAAHLIEHAGCDAEKITIVPNATRRANVPDAPLYDAGALPADIRDLARPIVGVIGNLAANMDWELLADAVRRTKGVSWLFVGPTTMPVVLRAQKEARAWVMEHARFTGARPYGQLQEYARCLDAAVLPYRKAEPTYSGSSTRFYEHLAAGRPMIATRGFAELLEKEPLVLLVDTGSEMGEAIARLKAIEFRDGLEMARWEASVAGTWEERARTLMGTVSEPAARDRVMTSDDISPAVRRS
jgi:glycosyltransferase involved in cell wall biosynthesis